VEQQIHGTPHKDKVSIVIPAFNEEKRIKQTLMALREKEWVYEIIVVDDGSTDQTFNIASKLADRVIRLSLNEGKSAALLKGCRASSGSILLFLDADLEWSATFAYDLIKPLVGGHTDMSIAILPSTRKGGLGLVKGLARYQIKWLTGQTLQAPLSGQRAIWRDVFFHHYKGDIRFGLEMGLSIDILKAGLRIKEVPISFHHRELGKSPVGFLHRFKQGIDIFSAYWIRR
jgi:glycosyltransferase involved in cell wall biosynthesis